MRYMTLYLPFQIVDRRFGLSPDYTIDQTPDLFAPEGKSKQMLLLLRVSVSSGSRKKLFWTGSCVDGSIY